jgi:hypothetical protein
MTSKTFWQSGFAIIQDMITQLEATL